MDRKLKLLPCVYGLNAILSGCLILSMLISPSLSSAEGIDSFPSNQSYSDTVVDVKVVSSDYSHTQIIIDISKVELRSFQYGAGYEAELPAEGHTSLEGVPSLPKISRLVAVPADAKIELNYEYTDSIIGYGIEILPTMGQPLRSYTSEVQLEYDTKVYSENRLFPIELVELGNPVIMRDLRLVRITVNPLRYNPVEKELVFYPHLKISLNYSTGGSENILHSAAKKVSRSFKKFYEMSVINYPDLELDTDEEMGSILIIAPDNQSVLDIIQPLVEWKTRKGFNTVVADLSQTGSTYNEIKAFIQDAYDTWEPQLEYLILIGDCAGTISVPPSNLYGDHDYQRLAGDDILPDISVGRFSCATTAQLMTEVNKVLEYESNPYMGETDWYIRGAVIAASQYSGYSTLQTKRGVRMKALQQGYAQVDTMWYSMPGSISSFTTEKINAGITFYNYRGWNGMNFSYSNINSLSNYHKYPFVVSITCGTGDITTSGTSIPEEFFRAGTPSNPIGAIGAIGTATHATHTRFLNCVDNGLFGGFFDLDLFAMGDALNSAKLDVYMSYPDNPQNVVNNCNWHNLIGDPACRLWTNIPKSLNASYPSEIPAGATSLTVIVTDSLTNEPLENVDCCVSGQGIQILRQTDVNGAVLFSLPLFTEGDINITCDKYGYKPHLGRVSIESEDVFIGYDDIDIDDDDFGSSSGNGDGNINPGEIIELGISLKNYGISVTATDITACLSCSLEIVVMLDSIDNFIDLGPFGSSEIQYGFIFEIDQSAYNQQSLPFYINVEANEGTWNSYLPLLGSAGEITYQTHIVIDPNNQLDPGEQSDIQITVMNVGEQSVQNLQAVLECESDFITIVQGTSNYGDIGVNQSSTGNDLTVRAADNTLQGSEIQFTLTFSGDNGFIDSTEFLLVVGDITPTDPVGPDEYGYYALDNTDLNYTGHPEFDWIEIDPTVTGYQFTGIDVGLTDYGNEQDDTGLLSLPFDFFYYGQTFEDIAVCSNGWIAFGEDMVYYDNFRNWYIPSTLGPYSLVAPFWDDLYLTTNPPRKVYYYYDETGHRFIVEWNVINNGFSNPPEIFQVILYDPAHFPSETGDGIIDFQYLDVMNIMGQSSDNHFATVGIKSPDNLMGIQYTYWNYYALGAAVLTDELAIRFSTNIPEFNPLPVIEDLQITISGDDITLNWNVMPSATVYHVYRASEAYYSTIGLTPIGSTTELEYIDTGIANNDRYFYRVTWESETE